MLRTKKTKLVGVVLPKINSDTISREVAGISDVLSKRGYQIILANTNNDLEEELDVYKRQLHGRENAGMSSEIEVRIL